MPVTINGSGPVTGVTAITGAGLDLITTQTFSAASSVSVNSCFSATYDNYRVVLSGSTSSADIAIRYRLRVGGTDNATASSYVTQLIYGDNTSVAGVRETADYGNLCWFNSALRNIGVADFANPAQATATGFTAFSNNTAGNARIHCMGGTHNQTTAYDGLTIYPASGTLTGTLRVYGYRNS